MPHQYINFLVYNLYYIIINLNTAIFFIRFVNFYPNLSISTQTQCSHVQILCKAPQVSPKGSQNNHKATQITKKLPKVPQS